MKKKRIWIVVGAVVILLIGGFGFKKYSDYQAAEKERKSWLAPYYNSEKEIILLSDEVDKLTDHQEQEFYDIARGAIEGENPDIDFTNIEDSGLFVKKMEGKHKYYLDYICEVNNLLGNSMKFKTSVKVNLEKERLKGENKFKYWDYVSDLEEY